MGAPRAATLLSADCARGLAQVEAPGPGKKHVIVGGAVLWLQVASCTGFPPSPSFRAPVQAVFSAAIHFTGAALTTPHTPARGLPSLKSWRGNVPGKVIIAVVSPGVVKEVGSGAESMAGDHPRTGLERQLLG